MQRVLILIIAVQVALNGNPASDKAEVIALNQRLKGLNFKGSRQVQDIRGVLSQRAVLLQRLMRSSPREALAVTLGASERHEVLEVTRTAFDLERADTVAGIAEVMVADREDGRAVTVYRVETASGVVEAFEDGIPASAACGDLVRIQGIRLEDIMAVSASEVLATDEKPVCGSIGAQKVAVLLVHPRGSPRPEETAAQFKEALFGTDGRTASNFYDEASYRRTSLSGDVYGWYETDRAYSCNDTNGLRAAAIKAADADADFTSYTRIYIVQPNLGRECGWRGLGTLACSRLTGLSEDGPINVATAWGLFEPGGESISARFVGTFIHEVGHNYGLGHSRSAKYHDRVLGPDRQRAEMTEYGDPYSIMGRSFNQGHFSAPMKARLTWISEGDGYQTVEAAGTFEMHPAESQAGGVKALRVLRSKERNEWVWLEYRQPAGGFDSQFPNPIRNVFTGAILRFEDPLTGRASELLDATPASFSGDADFDDARLEAGSVWKDWHSSLTIEVVSATAESLNVVVRYEEPCAALSPPSAILTFSWQMASFDASSSVCPFGALSNSFWLSLQGSEARDGAAAVNFEVSENAAGLTRAGSVTVDRKTFFVQQRGVETAPELVSLYPKSGNMTFRTYTPMEIVMRDSNGVADAKYIDFVWGESPDPSAGCSFRYDFADQRLYIRTASGSSFLDDSISIDEWRGVTADRCAVGFFTVTRVSATETSFGFYAANVVLNVRSLKAFVRLTDRTGLETDWIEAGTVSFGDSCVSLFRTGGVSVGPASQNVSVEVGSLSSCSWEVTTDANWLRFVKSSGAGNGRATLAVDALPEGGDSRNADLRIGEHVFRLTQLPILPAQITLDFYEASFGAQGGAGWIDVEISPSADTPVTTDSDWLLPGTTRLRSSGLAPFSVRRNTGERRIGRINVGDKVFTAVQAAAN